MHTVKFLLLLARHFPEFTEHRPAVEYCDRDDVIVLAMQYHIVDL